MSEDKIPAADDNPSSVSETSVPPDVPEPDAKPDASDAEAVDAEESPVPEESPVAAADDADAEGADESGQPLPAEATKVDDGATPQVDAAADASEEQESAELAAEADASQDRETIELTSEADAPQDRETVELAAEADASQDRETVELASEAGASQDSETVEATDAETSDEVTGQADASESEESSESAPAQAEVDDDDEAALSVAPGDDASPDEPAAADEELAGVSFAHAPTGSNGQPVDGELYEVFIDLDEEPLEDEEDEDELVPAGFDRRTDRAWWALTPISVLILGPLLAGSVAFFVAVVAKGYPAICRSAAADNGCDAVVLRMLAGHVVVFLIGAVLIWALPWWRGLRSYRIALAVIVVLVLIAAPLRLLGSVDYQTVMGQ